MYYSCMSMAGFWAHASWAYGDMAQAQWCMWSLALWGYDIPQSWRDFLTYDHIWLTYFLLKISFISILGLWWPFFVLLISLHLWMLHTGWSARSTSVSTTGGGVITGHTRCVTDDHVITPLPARRGRKSNHVRYDTWCAAAHGLLRIGWKILLRPGDTERLPAKVYDVW
jgi:hypothetical protein